MAGLFELKYEQEFTSSSSIVLTHNADNDFLKIRLIVNNIARPDLVIDIKPTVANPRNELTVELSSLQTGKIQIIETDVINANEIAASQPFEPGSILIALFASTANSVSNKFIDTDNIASSDVLPAVTVADGKLQRISFVGTGSTPAGTIEIFLNQTTTPDLIVAFAGIQAEIFDVDIIVTQGDQIHCKIGAGSSGVAKPLVKIYQ